MDHPDDQAQVEPRLQTNREKNLQAQRSQPVAQRYTKMTQTGTQQQENANQVQGTNSQK